MVNKIELKAKTRKNEKNTIKDVRKQGGIPAILYGRNNDNVKLLFNYHDFDTVYAKAGESSLVDLKIDDAETIKVIIKDIQKDPVKDSIIHADIYKVDMNKKIEVEIPFNFIGESKAIKELGGILIKSMDTLQIRSLPGDLIEKIDIDISELNSFGASIKVSDITIPDNLELVSSENALIVSVTEPAAIKAEDEEKTKEEAPEDKKEETKEADDAGKEADKKEKK